MKNASHRLLALLLCLLTTIPSPLFTQIATAQETKEEKKLRERQEKLKKKEEGRKDKEAQVRSKESRKYNTLREFAEDQYASEPDFRDAVDTAYRDLQSQHAMQAYQINTQRKTELVMAETEDATPKIRRVLYDNPWIQDYVNHVGQRLVPDDSDKPYAFKITYHPIPSAYTLSTGTVLVSTGMISLLDSEAQLAYLLAHELGHVYKEHWKVKVMMPLAEEEYNKRQERKRIMWSAIFGAAGAVIGGAIGGKQGIGNGAVIGLLAGYAVGSLYNQKIGIDWDEAQENEADDFALKATIDKGYDVKEVPKLFTAMDQAARGDQRVELGFLGRRSRLRERKEYCEKLLSGPLQGRYQDLLRGGKMIGTTADYSVIMAELKRDNGIEAYRFDMFEMSRRNLQQAVSIRSDDAVSSFYYGRILKLVGRTKEEHDQAQHYLAKAISLDTRQAIPEVQLQRALVLMEQTDPISQAQALQSLKDYVIAFQKKKVDDARHDSTLPPNIDVLYDHMRLLGDKAWKAPLPDYGPIKVVSADPPPPPAERPRTTRRQ